MSDRMCGTCRHWIPSEYPNPTGNWGDCNLIPDNESTGFAFTWDYEGFSSGLKTRGTFGCILHEAHER